MSTILEPITRERLGEFRNRRRMLIGAKGLALLSVCFVFLVATVIVLDAYFVLGQWIRWGLSGLLYSVSVVVGWLLLGRLCKPESLRETAAAFEVVEPRLHEKLLPAVELSEDTEAVAASSPGFRSALQYQVAEAIAGVHVGSLLPWRLIAGPLVVGSLVIFAFAAMMAWPSLHLPQRVARALMPGANLGRISRFHVEVVSPSPASLTVPEADVAAVFAKVVGPEADSVTLEATLDGELQRVAMRAATPDHVRSMLAGQSASVPSVPLDEGQYFVGNLTTTDKPIDYRVVVEDAHTPWYRITTRPRPSTLAFKKTFHYPSYSGLEDVTLEEDHGDIAALVGSQVTLDVIVDQPLKIAELKISSAQDDTVNRIALSELSNDSNRIAMRGLVDIQSNGTYRIDLESRETGFTNAFSSVYRIEAIADNVPQLTWQRPQANMMVVEPNQIVGLQFEVQDELPLATLELIFSKNAGPGTVAPIETTSESRATIAYDLDLLPKKVTVGDVLNVQVRATDRKGQQTLSQTLELVVSSVSIDPERQPATGRRIELAGMFRELTESLEEEAKKIRDLTEQVHRTPNEIHVDELRNAGEAFSQKVLEKSSGLRAAVTEAIKEPQDSVSLAELERVGQVLSRIETNLAPSIQQNVNELGIAVTAETSAKADREKRIKDAATQVRNRVDQTWDSTRVLDKRFREFVAHDVLAEVARSLVAIQSYQDEIVGDSESTPPETLKRQQSVVARQLRELEQAMVDRSPLLREGASGNLRGWIEWAGQVADRIERVSNDKEENINFKEFTKQIKQEVDTHQQIFNLDGGLAGELNNGRKELDARGGTASGAIDQLVNSLAQVSKSSPESVAEIISAARPLLLDHLQHRKDLERSRTDADPQILSDLGATARAAKDVLGQSSQAPQETIRQLKATAVAIRKLEAIHNVSEAGKHLADLEQIERWEATSVESRVEAPRTWDAFNQRLEQATRALGDSGIDPAIVKELDSIRKSPEAARADEKIASRRWSADSRASASMEMGEMQEKFALTRKKLADIATEIRRELGELSPSVPELARRAAEKTRELEQETERLKKAADAGEVPDLKPRMDQLLAQEAKIDEPLQDLRDALGELAGVQNILDKEQRDVARDADTSSKIVEQASGQVDETLAQATAATEAKSAVAPLEKAADAERRSSEALEKIAKHFEQLSGEGVSADEKAEARSSLAELARDVDMAGMDEWYKTAEMLSELTGMDPEKAMKRLEDELDRNPRMQDELSDISKKAVAESLENLKYSAAQENALQAQLEQSDPEFLEQKSLLYQDLQGASERIRKLMQQLTTDAGSAAARASQRDLQKQVEELNARVQSVTKLAEQSSVQRPLAELQSLGGELTRTLKAAKDELAQASDKLGELSKESVHPTEQDLRNRKREMEDWQRRVLQQQARDAQSVQRSHDQRLRQADNEVKQADQQGRIAERDRDELQKKLESDPENEGLKQQIAAAEERRLAALSSRDRLQRKQQVVEGRLERMKAIADEIAARKPQELVQPQPTAEFAARLARAAAETAEGIVNDLEKTLGDSGWTGRFSAAEKQLKSSGENQEVVEAAVTEISENLGRASRHEERLERRAAAAELAFQSKNVQTTASAEVHDATSQLKNAHVEAAAVASANGRAPDTGRAKAETSLQVKQSLGLAEQGIRDRAEDLAKLLADKNANQQTPPSNEPAQPTPPAAPSVPIDPKMLARMLDELDRAMTQSSSPQSQQPEQGNQQPTPQTSANGQPQDDNNQNSNQQSSQSGQQQNQTATMQEAARQLAAQMNRQRQQGSQSTASSRLPSNAADTNMAPPSAVRVLGVERRSGGDWGKLREQAAEQTIESSRGSIAPQYRQQVETYFRILSERSQSRDSK